jgi:hypothetical protein
VAIQALVVRQAEEQLLHWLLHRLAHRLLHRLVLLRTIFNMMMATRSKKCLQLWLRLCQQ